MYKVQSTTTPPPPTSTPARARSLPSLPQDQPTTSRLYHHRYTSLCKARYIPLQLVQHEGPLSTSIGPTPLTLTSQESGQGWPTRHNAPRGWHSLSDMTGAASRDLPAHDSISCAHAPRGQDRLPLVSCHALFIRAEMLREVFERLLLLHLRGSEVQQKVHCQASSLRHEYGTTQATRAVDTACLGDLHPVGHHNNEVTPHRGTKIAFVGYSTKHCAGRRRSPFIARSLNGPNQSHPPTAKRVGTCEIQAC